VKNIILATLVTISIPPVSDSLFFRIRLAHLRRVPQRVQGGEATLHALDDTRATYSPKKAQEERHE
jgi:hypothetical protein